MFSTVGCSNVKPLLRIVPALALAISLVTPISAQERTRPLPVITDTVRAHQLFVSNRWEDHPDSNYERAIQGKRITDSIYSAVTEGVVDYQKITYRSSVGDMDIPAYVYQPLEKRGPGGHPAMIWVHGGVHGNWGTSMWPFVREAVERGYVIIAPEYRGSTGYGVEPPPCGPGPGRDHGMEPRWVHHHPRHHAG
jgi:acetyl esterase/lipase